MKIGSSTLFTTLLLGTLLSLPPHAGSWSQPAKDPDWPCVQILVPTLSPGTLWDGPPIEEADPRWLKDTVVKTILDRATERSIAPADLEAPIEELARNAGRERNAALTAVFTGIFDAHDRQRSAAIAAVKRYARQQRALQNAIAQTLTALDAAPRGSVEAEELTAELQIRRQILDDRRRSLSAVCEQPVLVERRLGEFARIIAAHLE